MKKEDYRKIGVVSLFAIAFAFVETSIVIYLRKLFYPNGFEFPLKGFLDPNILGVEWIREIFTLIMLLTIGILAGKNFYEKFAYFLYSFAIWDIFYYIWLKAILNWPPSFITWDILFLVPLPWISPVLAPIVYSISMVALAFVLIYFQDKRKYVKISVKEWSLFIIGSAIILYTFMYDYTKIIVGGGFLKDYFGLASNIEFVTIISNYVPVYYNWTFFIVGEILIILSILLLYVRTKNE